MFKKASYLVLSLVLLFVFGSSIVSAKIYLPPKPPVATATPKPAVVETVNSFELFWPMVAGKTVQSKLYFLKTLKEDLRGLLIFGKAEKADYQVFIGIKRMLEAEILMKANLTDLANKTLDNAASDFDAAGMNIDAAKANGDIAQNIKDEINTRVNNLKKFTAFLIHGNKDYAPKLQVVLDKLNLISSKI